MTLQRLPEGKHGNSWFTSVQLQNTSLIPEGKLINDDEQDGMSPCVCLCPPDQPHVYWSGFSAVFVTFCSVLYGCGRVDWSGLGVPEISSAFDPFLFITSFWNVPFVAFQEPSNVQHPFLSHVLFALFFLPQLFYVWFVFSPVWLSIFSRPAMLTVIISTPTCMWSAFFWLFAGSADGSWLKRPVGSVFDCSCSLLCCITDVVLLKIRWRRDSC